MNYKNLIYFDIETTGQYKDFESFKLNDEFGSTVFEKKYEKNEHFKENCSNVEESYEKFAGLFSTFGKVVCFSFGYFTKDGHTISSISGDDEKELIENVVKLLNKVDKKGLLLSGYVINSFDVPFLIHKITKYGFGLPDILNIYDKKPWETKIFDLADKWKGGIKYYTSLEEVCYELNIDTPKDDIRGSDVHKTYWVGKDLNRIVKYCEKDVYSTMLVGKRMLEITKGLV